MSQGDYVEGPRYRRAQELERVSRRRSVALETAMRRFSGGTLRPEETDVAHLLLDNLTHREEIESAISYFVQNEAWPKLSFALFRLLLIRMYAANVLVLALVSHRLHATECTSPLPADLADRARMICWLLVDTWNGASGEFLEDYGEVFARASSQMKSQKRREK